MNKKVFLFLMIFIPSIFYAHSLLLNIFDNEDGTIVVTGVFSTGDVAAGAQIRLEAVNGGEVLYKKRLPSSGELTLQIPKREYKIVLNGGPGHEIIKDGIAPKGGFIKETQIVLDKTPTKEIISEKTILSISMILASILFLLTIIFGIKNTNRLMEEVKKSK